MKVLTATVCGSWVSAVIFAQTIDPNALGNASGWVGAGLLGAVLSWLLMIHLPAKDKQMREVLDLHFNERVELHKSAREEARIDRAAFEARASRIEAAIRDQTAVVVSELKDVSMTLRNSCHFERRWGDPKQEPVD